jgi:hypothetical protein
MNNQNFFRILLNSSLFTDFGNYNQKSHNSAPVHKKTPEIFQALRIYLELPGKIRTINGVMISILCVDRNLLCLASDPTLGLIHGYTLYFPKSSGDRFAR